MHSTIFPEDTVPEDLSAGNTQRGFLQDDRCKNLNDIIVPPSTGPPDGDIDNNLVEPNTRKETKETG